MRVSLQQSLQVSSTEQVYMICTGAILSWGCRICNEGCYALLPLAQWAHTESCDTSGTRSCDGVKWWVVFCPLFFWQYGPVFLISAALCVLVWNNLQRLLTNRPPLGKCTSRVMLFGLLEWCLSLLRLGLSYSIALTIIIVA